jgi:excisionase family DNA binding protein
MTEATDLRPRLLLTVEEAADLLGIGRTMAFGLIRDGDLETVQIGRLRRVPADAVAEYVALLRARNHEAA